MQRWEIVILSVGGGGVSLGVAGEQWVGLLGACAVIDEEGAFFGDWCKGGLHANARLSTLRLNDRLQFVFHRATGTVTVANLSRCGTAKCLCVLPASTNAYPVISGTGSWAVRLENYVDEDPCVLTLHASFSEEDRLLDCVFTNIGGDELVAIRAPPETTVSDLWDEVSYELSQDSLELILPDGQILTKNRDGAVKLCEVTGIFGAGGDASSSNWDAS